MASETIQCQFEGLSAYLIVFGTKPCQMGTVVKFYVVDGGVVLKRHHWATDLGQSKGGYYLYHPYENEVCANQEVSKTCYSTVLYLAQTTLRKKKHKEKGVMMISTGPPEEGPFEMEPFKEKNSESKAYPTEVIEEVEFTPKMSDKKLKVGAGLSPDLKEQLIHLFWEYVDIFTWLSRICQELTSRWQLKN